MNIWISLLRELSLNTLKVDLWTGRELRVMGNWQKSGAEATTSLLNINSEGNRVVIIWHLLAMTRYTDSVC